MESPYLFSSAYFFKTEQYLWSLCELKAAPLRESHGTGQLVLQTAAKLMTGGGKHCWQQPQHIIWNQSRRLRLSPNLLVWDSPPLQSMKLYDQSSLKRFNTKQVEQLKGRLTLSCVAMFSSGERSSFSPYILWNTSSCYCRRAANALACDGRLLRLFSFQGFY